MDAVSACLFRRGMRRNGRPSVGGAVMRLYICTDHAGHWPVGVASIVVAHGKDEAKGLLLRELAKEGLDTEPFTLTEVDLSVAHAHVLCNGNY